MRVKAGIALTAIVLTIAAIEIGLRLYLDAFGSERQKTLYLYSREEIQARQTLYQGMAFLNYGLSPSHEQVNSLGYRGPEIAMPKPERAFRIVAMGGSTTYGWHLEDWRDAYPHQLQRLLRDRYGYQGIEAINAGVPGYSSWESLVNLLLRVVELDPDMIIVFHGLNDVSARLIDPLHYDGLNRAKGFWVESGDPLPVSVLQRIALQRLGFSLDTQVALSEQFRLPDGFRYCGLEVGGAEPICGNLGMSASEVLASNPPVYFERNLRNMILFARAQDIDVVLLTWAYSPLAFEYPGGGVMHMAFRQAAVAEHNDIVRSLALERGVGLYDLAASMPTAARYFVNGVHMTAAGSAEMARQVAEYLVATNRLAR